MALVDHPFIRDLAAPRYRQILNGEPYDPAIHGVMFVVEPGDSVEQLEQAVGLPILHGLFDDLERCCGRWTEGGGLRGRLPRSGKLKTWKTEILRAGRAGVRTADSQDFRFAGFQPPAPLDDLTPTDAMYFVGAEGRRRGVGYVGVLIATGRAPWRELTLSTLCGPWLEGKADFRSASSGTKRQLSAKRPSEADRWGAYYASM